MSMCVCLCFRWDTHDMCVCVQFRWDTHDCEEGRKVILEVGFMGLLLEGDQVTLYVCRSFGQIR